MEIYNLAELLYIIEQGNVASVKINSWAKLLCCGF